MEDNATLLQIFMRIYIYELELCLNTKKDELKSVSFQSDEANTDRPLKEYLKKLIETSFTKIPPSTAITTVRVNDDIERNISDVTHFFISKVLLKEDITTEIKTQIREKKAGVYTDPDLCLEISDGASKYYESVELKSTKSSAIPGSSIQQILPYEWVIFIKHNGTDISITTGQYIYSINSKMQFPDRSPRPQVEFDELRNWNENFRKTENSTLVVSKDPNEAQKQNLISDWQNVLSERWLDILFNQQDIKNNEPWFNNNMRKFIISFLDKYDTLSNEEKQQFKCTIKSLIK